MQFDRSTRLELFVASFSIVPFYCTPFIISLYAKVLSNSENNIVYFPSIMMFAQLVLVMLLPAISTFVKLNQVFSGIFFVSFCVLSASLFLEVNEFYLSICALLIGLSSGSLFSFGTTISLNASDRTIAFLTRLAYTLVLTGLVSSVLVFFHEDFGLRSILIPISIFYFIFSFYIIFKEISLVASEERKQKLQISELAPLLLVFIFYLSQSGFYVFHASFYDGDFVSTALLAISRFAAGAVIIFLPATIFKKHSWTALIIWLAVEISSVLFLYQELNLIFVCFVIVMYEVSLNNLGAFAQARAGALSKDLALKYLAPSIIGGAALGPLFFARGTELIGESGIVFTTVSLVVFSVLVLNFLSTKEG